MIAGVDLGAAIRDGLGGLLETLTLVQDGVDYSADGTWQRELGTAAVLIPGTGTLGAVVPRPGDVLEADDLAFAVETVRGLDDVVWSLAGTAPYVPSPRAPAPDILARREPSGTGVHLTLRSALGVGAKWRSGIKVGGAAGFGNWAVLGARSRSIGGLDAALPYEALSTILDADGRASRATLSVVP